MSKLHSASLLLIGMALGPAAHAVDLPSTGHFETFDGMFFTSPPDGWSLHTGAAGTSASTWTTGIDAAGVAAMVPTSGPLTLTGRPSGVNNNGFNAEASTDIPVPLDRLIATSPGDTSGTAIQLMLTNRTGAPLQGLTLSYQIARLTVSQTPGGLPVQNELPGFWLFYSLDGLTWANVAGLNPTAETVPFSVGITRVAGAFGFGTDVPDGGNVWLRWVDDDAPQSSPDQILGLNVVDITPGVPEPGAAALLLAGLGMLGFSRRVSRSRASRRVPSATAMPSARTAAPR